jgi:hypothetical protein
MLWLLLWVPRAPPWVPLIQLLHSLAEWPPSTAGWKAFEDCCLAILQYLFVPPLRKPKIQVRSLSGIDRRDAVFPNREFGAMNPWGHLLRELEARMILFEFKNYDVSENRSNELESSPFQFTSSEYYCQLPRLFQPLDTITQIVQSGNN